MNTENKEIRTEVNLSESNILDEVELSDASKVVKEEFKRVSRGDMTDREIGALEKLKNGRLALSKSRNIDRLGRSALKAAMTYHSTIDLLPSPWNMHPRPHPLWSSMRPIDGAESLISKNFDNEIFSTMDDRTLQQIIETVSWRLREMDLKGVLDFVEVNGKRVPFTASEAAIYLKRETAEKILFGNYTFIEYVETILESWKDLDESENEDSTVL